MQKRILSVAVIAILLFSLFNWNCTKFDTTHLGSDLLPAVDNVNTFDTTLKIISTQQSNFSDTTYIGQTEDFAVGAINNDPLFGKTTANVFMQMKPAFYPYYMGGTPGDTLNGFGAGFDSVVLCLKFKAFWGDSLPIHLEVREVNDVQFGNDSIYKNNPTYYHPSYSGTILGSKDVDVKTLGNYVKFTNGRDSVNYQVRIRLDNLWGLSLYNRDSTKSNSANNAFYSDSLYRRFYNGLAVLATNSPGSNGLMYVNLADTASKIEIHYRRRNFGKVDSVYTSLKLNTSGIVGGGIPPSNTANNIDRIRGGFPIMTPSPTEHYLQTAPGTFVNLSIPELGNLPNCIIHRAEIFVEQVYSGSPLDDILSAPNFLYLDLKDTGTTKWKPIYYDLNTTQFYDPDYKSFVPYIANPIDYLYFGGYRRSKTDLAGNQIKYYNFNITKYVQMTVTKRTPNYEMRLYAPLNLNYPQYSPTLIPYSNDIAYGRVKIGSGTNQNSKLRLRIVYSKL